MSDPEKAEAPAAMQPAPAQFAHEYPSQPKRIVIMAALYLSIFLVTLVRFIQIDFRKFSAVLTNIGSKHHLDGNSQNHR
jgi:hypothetical protein